MVSGVAWDGVVSYRILANFLQRHERGLNGKFRVPRLSETEQPIPSSELLSTAEVSAVQPGPMTPWPPGVNVHTTSKKKRENHEASPSSYQVAGGTWH